MKTLRSIKSPTMFRWLGATGLIVAIAAGLLLCRGPHTGRQSKTPLQIGPGAAATGQIPPAVSAGSSVPSASDLARREALYPSFRKHPFAVARENRDYAWTGEDGTNPNVIRQLAHNELEFERMAEQSTRIHRRQLVYVKETADLRVQQSRLSGEPIRQLALPGLDGREVQFEITRSELSPSGQQGTFYGRVAGHLDSMVTLAFKGGREAFTIESPSENLFLQGEPREPGEILVMSYDPNIYASGLCGNP